MGKHWAQCSYNEADLGQNVDTLTHFLGAPTPGRRPPLRLENVTQLEKTLRDMEETWRVATPRRFRQTRNVAPGSVDRCVSKSPPCPETADLQTCQKRKCLYLGQVGVETGRIVNLMCNVATWTELCNVFKAEGGSTPRGGGGARRGAVACSVLVTFYSCSSYTSYSVLSYLAKLQALCYSYF